MAKRQRKKDRTSNPPKPIELFKLHLGDIPEEKKPILPPSLSYKKAISDYLREMGKLNLTVLNVLRILFLRII